MKVSSVTQITRARFRNLKPKLFHLFIEIYLFQAVILHVETLKNKSQIENSQLVSVAVVALIIMQTNVAQGFVKMFRKKNPNLDSLAVKS